MTANKNAEQAQLEAQMNAQATANVAEEGGKKAVANDQP